jgi:hypothetical protein
MFEFFTLIYENVSRRRLLNTETGFDIIARAGGDKSTTKFISAFTIYC